MNKHRAIRCLAFAALSLHIQMALAASCPMPAFEEPGTASAEIDDLQDSFESFLHEDITGRATPYEVAELEAKSPKIAATLGKLGTIAGAAVGTGMGIWSIKDGLDKGNTEEVVTGGITVGTSIGIPVAAEILTELAGEMAGEVFGGAAGVVVTEGFMVYNAVKGEELIAAAKNDNNNLKEKYHAYVTTVTGQMSGLKRIIAGDTKFLIQENLRAAPKMLFAVNEDKISAISMGILAEAAEVKARKMEGYLWSWVSDSGRWDPSSASDINSLKRMSEIARVHYGATTYTNPSILAELPGRSFFYGSLANHGIKHDYYDPDYVPPGGPDIYVWSGVKSYYEDLLNWTNKLASVAAARVTEHAFSDKDQLSKQLNSLIKTELTSTTYQKGLQTKYNETVKKRLAWFVFGQELLNDLDLTKFNEDEAALWIGRILLPFAEGFYDSTLTGNAVAEIAVAPIVMSLVNSLATQKIDINDDAAIQRVIHAKVNAATSFPSSLKNSISTALAGTKTKVAGMTIADSQLKALDYKAADVDAAIASLGDNYLADGLRREIDNYISLNAPNANAASSGFWWGLVSDATELQSRYMGKMADILDKGVSRLNSGGASMTSCQKADVLMDVANGIENLYLNWEASEPSLPTAPWVNFSSVQNLYSESHQNAAYARQMAGKHLATQIQATGQTCKDGAAVRLISTRGGGGGRAWNPVVPGGGNEIR